MALYEHRSSELQPTSELGFNQIKSFIDLVTTDAYQSKVTGDWESSVTFAEAIVIYNSSADYDALVKINEKDAIVVPAGMMRAFSFDSITKVEYKSKETGKATTLIVEIWGRSDIDV